VRESLSGVFSESLSGVARQSKSYRGIASEKVFPGFLGDFFGRSTPSKNTGVLVHKNSLAFFWPSPNGWFVLLI
jgi:hypothetical protein